MTHDSQVGEAKREVGIRVLTVLPPEPAAPSLQPRLAYSRDGTCRFIWAPATMGPPESRVPITYTARCTPCSSLKTKKFHQARLLVHPYELSSRQRVGEHNMTARSFPHVRGPAPRKEGLLHSAAADRTDKAHCSGPPRNAHF